MSAKSEMFSKQKIREYKRISNRSIRQIDREIKKLNRDTVKNIIQLVNNILKYKY